MLKPTLTLAVPLVVALLSAPARAAFILDDFDDPAEVVSPEMENVPVVSSGVGS